MQTSAAMVYLNRAVQILWASAEAQVLLDLERKRCERDRRFLGDVRSILASGGAWQDHQPGVRLEVQAVEDLHMHRVRVFSSKLRASPAGAMAYLRSMAEVGDAALDAIAMLERDRAGRHREIESVAGAASRWLINYARVGTLASAVLSVVDGNRGTLIGLANSLAIRWATTPSGTGEADVVIGVCTDTLKAAGPGLIEDRAAQLANSRATAWMFREAVSRSARSADLARVASSIGLAAKGAAVIFAAEGVVDAFKRLRQLEDATY